jgi:hypothetical protein
VITIVTAAVPAMEPAVTVAQAAAMPVTPANGSASEEATIVQLLKLL